MNPELFIKMALDGWQGEINATNNTLNKLSDEQLMQEIAPAKNRGIYLLGHLTAVHDMMLPLLRLENPNFPELRTIFVDSPDNAFADLPTISQLKEQWTEVNKKLQNHFTSLSADEWFTRHANVSEEDFIKEPHRNRLNVLMSRTNHLSNHRGQLVLLVSKI